MRKLLLSVLFTGLSSLAFSQVESGTLVNSGRKVQGAPEFVIKSAVTGVVIVELAVNRKGEVTSSKVIRDATTISSTPLVMKAQNMSKKLTFTPGTHFAEFEHVRIKYSYKP